VIKTNLIGTTEKIGHAVCFYQPTPHGNVMVYEGEGTLDLGTKSHDISQLIAAFNARYRDSGINRYLIEPQCIDGMNDELAKLDLVPVN
jgi:hypothetical protein